MENEILATEETINAETEKVIREDEKDFKEVLAIIMLIVFFTSKELFYDISF